MAGAAKLFVSGNGDISFAVARGKYDRPPAPAIEAKATSFGFSGWHAIGVSYGSQGVTIMVDGTVAARAPARKETLGAAGNHQEPLDIPTIGETVSHYWDRHRYDGGFSGTVALFRASSAQSDWYLARGVMPDFRLPNFGSADESTTRPKLPVTYVSDQTPADQLQLNADNTFSLQEAGQSYSGTFAATGSTLKLNISGGPETTATIQGNNLTDTGGQTWLLREQPGQLAPAADVPAPPNQPPAEPRQDQLNTTASGSTPVERNYIDIKLARKDKAKRFADITLTLKSADPKEDKYTVDVMADDKLVEKKDKRLNEPVQFYTAKGGHTPYELVINQIGKDQIGGYLSTPKGAGAAQVLATALTVDLTPVEPIYTEIKLGWTKQPQRFGEIALMLGNTDPEKQVYSVDVMADEKRTLKQDKNVNELVQFYTVKGGRTPYNLLINQVTKDGIAGYLWRQPVDSTADQPAPRPMIRSSSGPTQVTGRVVWNGLPVPNARVQLRQAGSSQSLPVLASTVSAADGTFTIEKPPTGRLAIYALAPTTDYWPFQIYRETIIAGQLKNVGDLAIAKKMQQLSPANGASDKTTTPTLQRAAFP